MSSPNRASRRTSVLLLLLLLLLSLSLLMLNFRITSPVASYSYLGDDAPQIWIDIGELDDVLMSVENSQRYGIDTPLGIMDWDALIPPGGGIIHLGQTSRPFTLSLFHQLHCLNILRVAIVDQATDPTYRGPGGLERHCMNYLREMILCRSDLKLENVRRLGDHVVQPKSTHTCRDWEQVYQEVAKNVEKWKPATVI